MQDNGTKCLCSRRTATTRTENCCVARDMLCICFKKIALFTFLDRILDLLSRTTYPAKENTLSDGTDVAGMWSLVLTNWNR